MEDANLSRGPQRLALALALVAAVVLLYLPAVGFGLVNFDDPDYVIDNPILNAPTIWASLRRAFEPHAGLFIPLTWLSLLLDRIVFGPEPAGFHLTNVLLHAANAAVLFLVLSAMTGATGRSWLVACLFALHPLRVESVAWITERKDVLSTLWALAMIAGWVRWSRTSSKGAYFCVFAAFVAGLLSKPMLVPMPLVLLLLDLWPLNRTGGRWNVRAVAGLAADKTPLLAISSVAALETYLAQRARGAVMPIEALGLAQRLGNSLQSLVWYPLKSAWPMGLSFFYPLRPVAPIVAIACAVALLGFSAFCLSERVDRPYLPVGWFWYLILVMPVAGLVQVGEQARADRFSYLPSIGLAIAAVWFVFDLVPSGAGRRAAVIVMSTVLTGLAISSRRYLLQWRDSLALGTHALAVDPDNYRAHLMVGMTFRDAGNIEEAMPHYQAVIRQMPEYGEARLAYANLLLGAGRPGDALPMFESLASEPDPTANVLNSYGRCLLDLGRSEDAAKVLRRAVAADPELAIAKVNLGTALAQSGDEGGAMAMFREAIRISPRNADARFLLGLSLGAAGESAAAIESLREATKLRPDSAEMHFSLAVELNEVGDSGGARAEIEKTLQLRPGWRRALAFREGLTTGRFPAPESLSE